MACYGCENSILDPGDFVRRQLDSVLPQATQPNYHLHLTLLNTAAAQMTKAFLSKEVSFSASHVLHVQSLSDKENFDIYGKCTRLHGHNYRVRVTLFGSVDEVTGMVMNAVHLKTWMEKAIMSQLDHRNIESDVEYFTKRPSTAENVAVFIWNEMIKVMPEEDRCKLYEVKLDETDSISVIYRGD